MEIENSEVEKGAAKIIPKVVVEYIKNMRDVNTFNQSAYCNFLHRHIKWHRIIIHWLIEISMNNSFLIYEKMNPLNKMLPLEFRIFIIEE